MKTIKQLFRQPIKTLGGLLLMTIAVSILCVCVCQALAADKTNETLNQQFSSIAIPLLQENEDLKVTEDMLRLDPELSTWLQKITAEHPEIVQGVSEHGLLSAYIPEMTPLNITSDKYEKWLDSFVYIQVSPTASRGTTLYNKFKASPSGRPQSCAMFVITLEEIDPDPLHYREWLLCDPNALDWDDFPNGGYFDYWQTLDKFDVSYGYAYKLSGTVTQVISLPDGYRDPVGMTARLKLKLPTEEAFEALCLEPGQQYIVYGMDYFDEHWALSSIDKLKKLGDKIENYDPSLLKILTEEESAQHSGNVVALYDGVNLQDYEYEQLNAISMTLDGPLGFLEYDLVRDEKGYLMDVVEKTTITFTNVSGETVTIPADEYREIYRIPTITKFEGSIEEFLDSKEGAIWQEAVNRDQINNHAFAVIGAERLHYLETFAFGDSKITGGRDFTAEERENGARVCIVNEKVAALNGLKVGDTITLNMYATDYGLPYQQNFTDGRGILDPLASFYFDTTPFADAAEYTIVGLWRGPRTWADLTKNQYSFSANTVFVPKSSVKTTMDTCDSVLFNTVVLQNGRLEQFKELLIESGFAGRFRSTDQGYSEIAVNFHNFRALAKKVLTVGVAVYVILLLLFLLLYPGSHRKAVRTMQSLGCHFGKRFGHMLLSSMAIMFPASVAGGLLGMQLWGKVIAVLQASVETSVAIHLQPNMLMMVVAAQLLLALILNVFVALFVAAPRGMSSRR